MPPKKANKAKATPAKAAAAVEPPATVTTARGKQYETTAAAGRPRRASTASADTPAPSKVKKTASAKKAASTKAAPAPAAGKKRGRPAKVAVEEVEAEPPKKRGRPSKAAEAETVADPPKRKPGRPPKSASKASAKDLPAVTKKETAPPKKRGRPPKGGETTKVEVADDAAAEQLEEELVDTAESKPTSLPKKKGRPPKGKKATTKAVAEDEEEDEAEDEDATTSATTGKQFWLMKAEQEDREETLKDGSVFNAKFTIDDLRAKGGPEPWDGVRNAVACKNMKDMKLGDLAFFYASGGKKGRVPGIVGIMEVVKESEPDMSAFDENSPNYVENAKTRGTQGKPRWFMVHVEYRKKLENPVTLKELQKYAKGDGVLSKMQEFTAARLSVSKVTEEEWNFIVDNLIEGYEDEALPTAKIGGDTPMADAAEVDLPNAVKTSIESDIPTTDTALAVNTAPTSRQASRAGSRAPSQEPTDKGNATGLQPPSRSGSRARSQPPAEGKPNNLQPPSRSGSRAGSRTPGGRAGSAKPMTTVPEEL